MIWSLEGTVVEKSPAFVVLDVHGVCFGASVSLTTSEALGGAGARARLFTRLFVREEGLELFGFASDEERRLFDLLIGIPGVGPKVALRVLSGLSPSQLEQAVLTQDISTLTKVPGVGKKIAERLVVELKGQVEKIPAGGGERTKRTALFADAVEALVVLGYRRQQASSAVTALFKGGGADGLALEAVIKEALKRI